MLELCDSSARSSQLTPYVARRTAGTAERAASSGVEGKRHMYHAVCGRRGRRGRRSGRVLHGLMLLLLLLTCVYIGVSRQTFRGEGGRVIAKN